MGIRSRSVKISAIATGVWACLGCAGAPDSVPREGEASGRTSDALSVHDFDVDFSGCTEFVGIGQVPAANARLVVPQRYTLAGDATRAVVVVRVSRCADAVIDGKARGAITVSQIGISVVGQDSTADINNYTFAYATDQALLHARYSGAGVDADKSNKLTFTVSSAGLLEAESTSAHTPTFLVRGPTIAPSAAPVRFVASWWADGVHGVVRSRTVFPAIRFGTSTATLTTPAGSSLAQLIGATTLTFPLLNSANTFPNARLEVRDTD